MKAVRKLTAFSFCSIFLLFGCATPPKEAITTALSQSNWDYNEQLAGDFYLFRAISPTRQGAVLNIVIEGDGRSWLTRYKPSKDPTPINPVGFSIANGLNGPTAYLARPCQFISHPKKKNCDPVIWTSARFSPEVISSTSLAIDQIKKKFSAESIRLFGYSGGGTLAALVTARRKDVIELITIASPLDIKAWATFHKMSELRYSMNPALELKNWTNTPQRHYMGEADEIVPAKLNIEILRSIGNKPNIKLISVPMYDHSCCWNNFSFN